MSETAFQGLPLQGSPRTTGRGGVRVHEAEPRDYARWDRFVTACSEATFFHRAGWKTVIEEAFAHRTLLPLRGSRRPHRRACCRSPRSRARCSATSWFLCRFAFTAASRQRPTEPPLRSTRLRRRSRICGASISSNTAASRPAVRPGSTRSSTSLSASRYTPTTERNMLDIPRKQRAMVRKGIKAGLVSEHRPRVRRFLRAYSAQRSSARHAGILPSGTFADPARRFRPGVRDPDVTKRTARRVERHLLLFSRRSAALLRRRHGARPRSRRQRLHVLGGDAPSVRARCSAFSTTAEANGHGIVRLQAELGIRAEAARYDYLLVKGKRLPTTTRSIRSIARFIRMLEAHAAAACQCLGPHIVRELGEE